jgi:hypothetical protein
MLKEHIPYIVGDCIENEWHNAENGDGLQRTTGGLLVWRKADNWTAFTDGATTWINGPYGLVSRRNHERFEWEGELSVPVPPPPAASAPPPARSDSGLVRGGGYEHREENRPYNARTFGPPNPAYRQHVLAGFGPYYDRITGMKTGTTAELILWAADSWGVPRSLALALAWNESLWKTRMAGDYQTGRLTSWGDYRPLDYQSYGMIQIKRSYWPDSFPKARDSTAYGLSYGLAILRAMYDGALPTIPAGGSWDRALQAYFDGQPGTPGGVAYSEKVRRVEADRPWKAIER